MKQKLSFLLTALMFVLGTSAWALEKDADGIYQIGTAEDLVAFSRVVNGGETSANAVLTADIDLSSVEAFPPIGTYSDNGIDLAYRGTFDGKGHVVKNLKINVSDTQEAGLFSRLFSAMVRNLGIVNASVTNGANVRAGVFAGEIHVSNVFNCFTAGDLTVETSHAQKCGFAGEAAGSNLYNCYTTHDIFSNDGNKVNCYWGEGTISKAPTGELCFLLNGNQSDIVWYQTLGEDQYPVPDPTHGIVYTTAELRCDGQIIGEGTFTNDAGQASVIPDHKCENGVCTVCGLEFYINLATKNIKILENLDFKVNINTNVLVTLELPDWIEAVDAGPIIGSRDYLFRAKPMTSPGRRTAPIIVNADGMEPQEIMVDQVYVGDWVPDPLGWWTFDNPYDIMYEEGYGKATLSPAFKDIHGLPVKTNDPSAAGITTIPGPTNSNVAILVDKDSYLWLTSETGVAEQKDFTILYDIKPRNLTGTKSIFQNDITNGKDAGLFIRNNTIGRASNIGYHGNLQNNTWYRILFVVKDGCPTLYINGEKLSEYNLPVSDDWILNDEFLLFADDSGEEGAMELAGLRFWDIPLSESMAERLGNIYSDTEKLFLVEATNVLLVDKIDFSVKINTNMPITFELPDWIEPVDVEPVEGEKEYIFHAKPMEEEGRREDVIIVNAEDFEPIEVSIVQVKLGDEVPEPTGWWTFDNSNNLMHEELGYGCAALHPAFKGSGGPEMTNDIATAGISVVPGPTSENGAILIPKDSYLWFTSYTGNPLMKDFTILYDIKPSNMTGTKSIFQNDITNRKDAGLFIRNNTIGRGSNIGYHGNLQPDTWYRILFVVKEGCPTIYINGEKLSEYNKLVYDDLILNDEFLLFADDDGEEGDMELADLRFWDIPLSANLAEKLGDVYSDVEKFFFVKTSNVRLIDKIDFSIKVNTNIPVTFELPDWIEPVDVEPVEGEKEYIFQAKPMEQEGRREDEIIVKAENFDPIEVPIVQIKLGENIPEPTGWWTFDNPKDLLACTGTATLQAAFKGENGPEVTTELEVKGFLAVDGPTDDNGAIGVNEDTYLLLTNNTGCPELKDYAIQLDIRPRSMRPTNALYQTNIKNDSDAGLLISKSMVGKGSSGLGYHGELIYAKWHRIIFVVKNGFASVYLDGEKVGQSSSANDIWTMLPEALLFADDNGEETYNDVAEVRFWDVPLSDIQVERLGGVEQEWERDPFVEPTSWWTFDNPDDLLAGTGEATLRGAMKSNNGPVVVEDLSSAGIVPVEGPSEDNGAITVPIDSYLQMAHNQESSNQESFAFMMDVRPKITDSKAKALLQTDPNNKSDAMLFIKNNTIGLNSTIGYAEGIVKDEWQRIIIVVEANSMTGIYVNGLKVNGTFNTNGRWALQSICYLFADDSGEEGSIDIAELRYWNTPIGGEQAKALGGIGTKTNIKQIPIALKMPAGIYDLMGRKIISPNDKLRKGVYIMNGKKVLIR